MSTRTPTLWHFTCADHGYRGLGNRGVLRANSHPFMPELGRVCWLTDDPRPTPDDVGLTALMSTCDRLAFRYRVVATSGLLAWREVRHAARPEVVADLERFGQPDTWWVCDAAEVVLA